MDAEVGQRRQDFRRMMSLVQFPESGNAMLQRMIDEEAQFVSKKEYEGSSGAQYKIRRFQWRALTQVALQEAGDDIGDRRGREERPTEKRAEGERSEKKVADIGEGRTMKKHLAPKHGAGDRAQPNAAAPAFLPLRQKGESQRHCEGDRIDGDRRRRRQEHVNDRL